MNLEPLKVMREELLLKPDPPNCEFDMSVWFERLPCGTAYCMGGWIEARYADNSAYGDATSAILGLIFQGDGELSEEVHRLFMGDRGVAWEFTIEELSNLNKEDCLEAVDRLIEWAEESRSAKEKIEVRER